MSEIERIAKLEANTKHISEGISGIKTMLNEQSSTQAVQFEKLTEIHRQDVATIYSKFNSLDKKYSSIYVQKILLYLVGSGALALLIWLFSAVNNFTR